MDHINNKSTIAFLLLLGLICRIDALTCEAGWEGPSPAGKCYQIYPQPTFPYEPAQSSCKGMGGELASIENQLEVDFLINQIFPKAKDWLVTGGHRVPLGTGPWVWADGSPITFMNSGDPALNFAEPVQTRNFLYIYSHPHYKTDKGNYGKTFQDRPVAHEVLCQKKIRKDPEDSCCANRDNNNGGCGGGWGGCRCGGCGGGCC